MIRTDTIPIATHCERCMLPHVDADEAPVHRSHECVGCGHSWTPHPLPTHGMQLSPRLSYHEYVLLRYHRKDLTERDAWCLSTRERPRALLVGEAPGSNTWGDCPLFPWPLTSAGGRLWQMSGIPIRDYLRDFQRVNLLTYCPEAWNREVRHEAGDTARILASSALHVAWPCVLLGNRVAQAFDASNLPVWEWHRRDLNGDRWVPAAQQDHGLRVIRIPHPSGRSRPYNDPRARERLRTILQEALS